VLRHVIRAGHGVPPDIAFVRAEHRPPRPNLGHACRRNAEPIVSPLLPCFVVVSGEVSVRGFRVLRYPAIGLNNPQERP